MNQARDSISRDIIDAESLKHLYEEGLSVYECIDEKCRIKLLPCSFKPTNKNRPYFKTLKGENHKKTCKFSEYLRLLEKAKNKALTEYELEDMPFPTKLKIVKQIEKDNFTFKTNDIEEQSGQIKIKKQASGNFINTLNKSKVVASISPIVDFYLKCPFNRNENLEIEGVKKPYMYWFKRIKSLSTRISNEKYIYFGRLHTGKNKILENDVVLEITLYENESWVPRINGKGYSVPYIIRVSKSNISDNKLSRIKNELNFAIDDKKKDFNNGDTKKEDAFIFFFGKASENEPHVLNVIEGNVVARYTKILQTRT